jgi:2-C-methyl-D-erythritol 4-phosphate cytidylyltransferase/2-C-methyl-D-erythritol 2,4-cyclodiphosphate synthase
MVLVVAAGKGVRAGAGLPKQYRSVAGKRLLGLTMGKFLTHDAVTGVCAAINPLDEAYYQEALADFSSHPKLLPWAEGGAERQQSVRAGLEHLAAYEPDLVLIHDGVRPFVTPELVSRLIKAAGATENAGAIAALRVVDTIKREDGSGHIAETIDRTELWRAQTPQAFKFEAILAAHRDAKHTTLTDDAAVAEAAGLRVTLIEGDADNIKITTPDDFKLADRLFRLPDPSQQDRPQSGTSDMRVGFGYDVHRFGEGDHVILCGVAIPHERGLAGHSDADVALHALTDALLGAVGAGDIGHYFPPSDEQWRGAASHIFVEHAVKLIETGKGRINNVDVTIICERPKIGPHRDAMAAAMAALLNLPIEQVNIKATTTEKLGFTGREEGIAAQAVATVRFD